MRKFILTEEDRKSIRGLYGLINEPVSYTHLSPRDRQKSRMPSSA